MRHADSAQLRGRYMRIPLRLERSILYRIHRKRPATTAGRRQSGARTVGRSRLIGCRRAAQQSHRIQSDLHFRGPWNAA